MLVFFKDADALSLLGVQEGKASGLEKEKGSGVKNSIIIKFWESVV